MRKKDTTARYTADEAAKLRQQNDQTDWARVHSLSQKQIEAAAADDDEGMTVDWTQAQIGLPETKAALNMRIDRDVLEFFKREGRGYQTRINAVLRAFRDASA